MKAFLTSVIAIAVIALGSDYLLGGPVFDSGGVLLNPDSAASTASSSVRLPGQ